MIPTISTTIINNASLTHDLMHEEAYMEVQQFAIDTHFSRLFFCSKGDTWGCKEAFNSKLPYLKEPAQYAGLAILDLSCELKTLCFKCEVAHSEEAVAIHFPATKYLPGKRNFCSIDFEVLADVFYCCFNLKCQHIEMHPNLKYGCVNPISLYLGNDRAYHLFDNDYANNNLPLITTNAGHRNIGVSYLTVDLLEAFIEKKVNFQKCIFNY